MAGGILWRLAQDVVSEKAVTRGPSICSVKKFHLVGDALSSIEMDIICGVYFVGSKFHLLVLLCTTCQPLFQKLRTRIHSCRGGRNITSGRRAG